MKTRIITIIIGAALLIGAGFFFINRSSEPATVAVTEQTIILDVRTPAEFAEAIVAQAIASVGRPDYT